MVWFGGLNVRGTFFILLQRCCSNPQTTNPMHLIHDAFDLHARPFLASLSPGRCCPERRFLAEDIRIPDPQRPMNKQRARGIPSGRLILKGRLFCSLLLVVAFWALRSWMLRKQTAFVLKGSLRKVWGVTSAKDSIPEAAGSPKGARLNKNNF